jgi:DNA-binding XRE family transcriptional regulator
MSALYVASFTPAMSCFRDVRPGMLVRAEEGQTTLSRIKYRFMMTVYRLVGDHLPKNRTSPMTSLGSTARSVRESLGLTQRAAAESLGVSAVHLSNVVRGVTPPSASLIAAVRRVVRRRCVCP